MIFIRDRLIDFRKQRDAQVDKIEINDIRSEVIHIEIRI